MLAGQPLDAMTTGVPLKLPARADEVPRWALWLASGENSRATGAEFVVDGGALA
jgi:NAD(P)-dependent dehydrogenase (short-subunit alcohol dehydrogenase family)